MPKEGDYESELLTKGGIGMAIVKVRINRQVTIPKSIFEKLGLKEGDLVEVDIEGDRIVMRPKGPTDDVLTPEEEEVVERGFRQLRQGDYTTWESLKRELDL